MSVEEDLIAWIELLALAGQVSIEECIAEAEGVLEDTIRGAGPDTRAKRERSTRSNFKKGPRDACKKFEKLCTSPEEACRLAIGSLGCLAKENVHSAEGDLLLKIGHIILRMANFKNHHISHHLNALAQAVAADPGVIDQLKAAEPVLYDALAAHFASDRPAYTPSPPLTSEQILANATLPATGPEAGVEKTAALSPEAFFTWFAAQKLTMPHSLLRSSLEAFLARQIGANYGIERNKRLASGVQDCLNALELRVKCPGGTGKVSCGEPSQIRFRGRHKDYPEGYFFLQHSKPPRGQDSTSVGFPPLELIPAPPDDRRKILPKK